MPTPLIILGVAVIVGGIIWGCAKLNELDNQHRRRPEHRFSGGRGSGSSGSSAAGGFFFGDGGGDYSGGYSGGDGGGSCDGGGGGCD